VAPGGDLDTVLKKMFHKPGETRRINEAEKLGHADYLRLKRAGPGNLHRALSGVSA
jgi:hypothetical protein